MMPHTGKLALYVPLKGTHNQYLHIIRGTYYQGLVYVHEVYSGTE